MARECVQCGKTIVDGGKFCSVCGARVSAAEDGFQATNEGTQAYSPFTGIEGRALRVLTGSRAGEFVSVYPSVTIGRNRANFNVHDDETLSPVHARVFCMNDICYLDDLESHNGVLIRIAEKTILHDRDVIRAGQTFFRFEHLMTEMFSDDEGTSFYATPMRGERFRLVELLDDGYRGRAKTASEIGLTVGRKEGNFLFEQDTQMNPRHFTIRWTQRGGVLTDHASMNGTFVSLQDTVELHPGDQFFLGCTLFGVL